jgi:hypothetical protein
MQMDDMILVSIDDHSIEPPTMYEQQEDNFNQDLMVFPVRVQEDVVQVAL